MTKVELLGAISTGIGILLSIWFKLIKPFLRKRKVKKEEKNIKQNKEKDELSKKIDFIVSELKVDGNGSMKTAIINLQKITERIEFKITGLEENQKTVLNLQGVAYWISDEQGLCTYASPNLCNLVGRSEQELLGNNWLSWIASEDRERITNAWCFSVENATSFDELYTVKKSDGDFIKVWGAAFPKIGRNVYGGIFGKLVLAEGPFKRKEDK